MFEKVNPSHPDKIADRIAGAIVDLAYEKEDNPRIAVEVLIGHGACYVIAESSVMISRKEVIGIVERITGMRLFVNLDIYPQDDILAENQSGAIRCGDNGIFKGVPISKEQRALSALVKMLYKKYPHDGKFMIDDDAITACQSNVKTSELRDMIENSGYKAIVNPLGDWTGGIDVDSGATNRKLGSDMGDSVTGGGLHGKDLSKADVSVNIYAWLKARNTGETVEMSCAIGDEKIDGKPYAEIVEIARRFIESRGGFEKFAEWGLI